MKTIQRRSNLLYSGLASLGLSLFLFACSSGVSNSTLEQAKAESAARAGGNTGAAVANPNGAPGNTPAIKPVDASTQPATAPTVDPATLSKIEFDKTNYEFGTVKEGEKVRYTFKFKNTGDKPLTITSANASCGCTVPQWPKEPIAPGANGEIKVEFDSKGKVGPQTKTVTVTANTEPAQTMLQIKGEVIAASATGATGK